MGRTFCLGKRVREVKKPSRSLGLDHTSWELAYPPSQPVLGPTPNPEFATWCLPAPQWELCPPPVRMVAKNPGSEAPPHLNIKAAAGCWFLERETAPSGPYAAGQSLPGCPRPWQQKQHLGVGSDQPCEDHRPRKPRLLLLLHGVGGTRRTLEPCPGLAGAEALPLGLCVVGSSPPCPVSPREALKPAGTSGRGTAPDGGQRGRGLVGECGGRLCQGAVWPLRGHP